MIEPLPTSETQMAAARAGCITPAMRQVAESERLPPETIRRQVADGRIVIPWNPRHAPERAVGIGRLLRTKVNANIGNSPTTSSVEEELAKLDTAVRSGADAVMDLSTGPAADEILDAVLEHSPVPVGTVPIYRAVERAGEITRLTIDDFFDVVVDHAERGVDFMTIHAGLRRAHLPLARRRRLGIVSRGGALLAAWMTHHGRENPYYEHFDRLLEICARYDITLSLGDGLRPGCLADASDEAQFAELDTLGELVRRCREAGVQAMVEGPGHIPMDQIEMNMRRERERCHDAPFYVLGPVVIDCAPGYDHITAAIGGALAAYHGAAMLCYVTPREHLGLPDVNDVRMGVIASRIAAHAADVALRRPDSRERDDEISDARRNFDWARQFDLALDPETARRLHRELEAAANGNPPPAHGCTMCGSQFCAVRISRELAGTD